MLAFIPPEELRQRLDGADFVPCTDNTITNRADLEADLAKVRQRGFSINDEEWVLGLRSTAAPIMDENGAVAGAINVSVPTAEVPYEELISRFSPAVRATAAQISAKLGYEALASEQIY